MAHHIGYRGCLQLLDIAAGIAIDAKGRVHIIQRTQYPHPTTTGDLAARILGQQTLTRSIRTGIDGNGGQLLRLGNIRLVLRLSLYMESKQG